MKVNTLLILLASTANAWADFTVPWQTLDGGGDSSSATIGASTWRVTGTIGQPDASIGSSSNANGFAISSGYWAIAIPTVGGGPALTITVSGPNALITWGADAVGYKLQYSNNLTVWVDQPGTITGASALYFSLANGPKYFFRLKPL